MISILSDVVESFGDYTNEAGAGGTRQQRDGVWVAWVGTSHVEGVYGMGPTERHALAALKAKMQALLTMLSVGYAEAAAESDVRRVSEVKEAESEMIEKLAAVLGVKPVQVTTGDDN